MVQSSFSTMEADVGNSEKEKNEHSETALGRRKKWNHRRNLIAFWFLGLCNNFAYVVMLSAAHDILKEEENTSGTNETSNATTVSPTFTTSANEDEFLTCNTIGTGAILLADILPTLIIKLTAPFYIQRLPYWFKTLLVVVFAIGSFVTVGLAHQVWLSILGVVFASCSAGLGEVTFLSLSTFYDRNVVSTWSSGTGGAGVGGALAYAGLTSAGLSARNTVFVLISVPILMSISYFIILTKPENQLHQLNNFCSTSSLVPKDDESKSTQLSLAEKLRLLPPLLKYMIPLTVVYFAEYFINQGLHELLYFNSIFLSKAEQYRWYQVDYQVGVFISRSSVNIIQIKHLWILPILQLVNMALLLSQVFYRFIPNVWVIFAIVLWEGLLGGGAYVNTFYKMSKEVPAQHREFSLGAATLGDSVGIALAGAAAIPSHDHICTLRIKM
ncbi:battenin-like isoform X3 [Pomacea canaliculata]|uniref:battenin-like isoform X3 n=1 Tax=Pomacea canaliculata TaxID=400727 RepID=UPI000D72F73A|nr:battenin-like isoform X3 [Pomacea canaliculata]